MLDLRDCDLPLPLSVTCIIVIGSVPITRWPCGNLMYEWKANSQLYSHSFTYTDKVDISPPLDNIRVMVIVWRLRGNIIRTALCWIVWHNVHSPQHTYVSSSYRSNGLGLSYWDPYAVHRGGCLELHYCNMVEWFWWDSSLISTTNWFPSVLWHCWFGHLACKNCPRNNLLCVEWDV